MGDVIPFRNFKHPVHADQVEVTYCRSDERHVEFRVGHNLSVCGKYIRFAGKGYAYEYSGECE